MWTRRSVCEWAGCDKCVAPRRCTTLSAVSVVAIVSQILMASVFKREPSVANVTQLSALTDASPSLLAQSSLSILMMAYLMANAGICACHPPARMALS